MRFFLKEKIALAVVVSCLALLVFTLLMITNTITNIRGRAAVEPNGIGVYWDSNCSSRVTSIDWGTLTPGSVKSIVVYIRNEVEEPTYSFLWTTNWNPQESSIYLSLGWDHSGRQMNPGETLQTTLTLSVSRSIQGISSFSFDIVIVAVSDSFPGDVNGDGKVTITDIVIIGLAFGSEPGDANWDPRADVNQDGIVTIVDVVLVAIHFGEEA